MILTGVFERMTNYGSETDDSQLRFKSLSTKARLQLGGVARPHAYFCQLLLFLFTVSLFFKFAVQLLNHRPATVKFDGDEAKMIQMNVA